jgi:hypothetical protein
MAENKNKPKETAIRQQRLKAFEPIHTAYTTAAVLGGVGILFFIVGSVLFVYADCNL